MNCSKVLPTDEITFPTGEMKDVEGSPYDFRGGVSTTLGDLRRLDGACEGGGGSHGIDNNFAIDRPKGSDRQLVKAVDVRC